MERHDLELMKERTSIRCALALSQLPELFDIADELGSTWKMSAFLLGRSGFRSQVGALTRQLTAELVERDLSHPSVAYWSAGNESDWGRH